MGLTTQNEVTDALTSAMQTIAESNVQSKEATLTIEAEIVEVIDEGLGKYKVKYLGNKFDATTAHTEVTYQVGDMVYVIVPNGNFDKNKVILSPVAPSAASYAYPSSSDEEVSYINISDNLFKSTNNISMCTWKPNESIKTRDDYDNSFGFIPLFQNALKDSRVFNFSCKIQTSIEKEHQYGGNYGLKLHIPVYQNINGEQVATEYVVTLDTNNIIGDPYNLAVSALQNVYFTFPDNMTPYEDRKSSYQWQDSITPWVQYFVKDFNGIDSTKPDDIFITDIKIMSALEITKENKTGYFSIITATEGNSFLFNRTGDRKILSVTPYLNGKVIKSKDFECYWFKENVSINPESNKYHRYGGRGWEILNEINEIDFDENGKANYQYIYDKYTQKIEQSEIHCDTKFKCVLIKDDKYIISYITIKNLASTAFLNLNTITGNTTFFQGIGNIELQLKYYELGVTDINQSQYQIGYFWARYDKKDNFIDDNFYTVDNLNDQKDGVYYTKIHFPVSKIDEKNTISCTVYMDTIVGSLVKRQIIGTKSIVITIGEEAKATILVSNGDKLYKYDSDGNSPMYADYNGPLSSIIKIIDPLEIKIFKEDGTEFSSNEYNVTTIDWLVPINSMIKLSTQQKTDTTTNPGYYTISGNYSVNNQLSYGIENKYSYSKSDNTIIIKANTPSSILKDTIQNTVTIQFLKEGANGTNGTNYSAIVTWKGYGYEEKDSEGRMHKFQLIYAADTETWYQYDPGNPGVYTPFESTTFGCTLYRDGTSVSGISIQWKIFEEEYQKYKDSSYRPLSPLYYVDGWHGGFYLNGNKMTGAADPFCTIIQAQITTNENYSSQLDKASLIYAYYPVECSYVAKEEFLDTFIPTMTGGYFEVLYNSDGTNPKWDNSIPLKVINSRIKDIEELYFNSIITTSFNSIPKKFDSGKAVNYAGSMVNVATSDVNNVISKIDSLNLEKNSMQNKLNYYQTLQENLNVFYDFNDFDTYKINFVNTRSFYSVKTELTKTVDQLLNQINILKSLCETYIETEEGNFDINIQTLYNEVENKLSNLDTLSYLIARLGAKDNAINQVKNKLPKTFIITNKISYNGMPNRDCYFTINNNIDLYNNIIISTYATYLNSLNDADVITGEEIARNTITFLNIFISDPRIVNLTKTYYGHNEESYKYSGLIKIIEKRVESAGNKTDTYSYNLVLENIINPTLENLSWYISFSASDNYLPIIDELQDEIDSYDNTINTLTELKRILMDMHSYTNPIAHYKPILFLYNRYELDFINNWDGNKLELGDGYLIAPQMGAGIKDNLNRFTGIVMGVKQVKEGTRGDIGLFGYSAGIQSIFLNAKTGSATFGQRGEGQIIFEPSAKQAIIKSGNYNDSNSTDVYVRVYPGYYDNPVELAYFEYIYDPTQEKYDYILSTDTRVDSNKAYYKQTSEKAGMLIDLSTPEIKFGTGNFKVTKEGHITAKGGGEIAGWTINDTQMFKNNLYIDSGTTKTITVEGVEQTYTSYGFYSNKHDKIDSTTKGFYLGPDGLSINGEYRETTYPYNTIRSRFEINVAGNPKLFSGNHDALNATSRGFYLGQDGFSISNGARSRFEISTEGDPKLFSSNHVELKSTSDGFYLGNDGMSIGSKIYIDKTGLMRIGYRATTGDGSHYWTIDGSGESSISYGTPGESGSVYIGTNKITLGSKFSVDNQGNLKASEAELSGKITATSGSIAGWVIDGSMLKSANGSVKINSEGYHNLEGPNAYIDLSGTGSAYHGCHINADNVVISAAALRTTRYRSGGDIYEGKDFTMRFMTGNENWVRLTFINGLLVNFEDLGSNG